VGEPLKRIYVRYLQVVDELAILPPMKKEISSEATTFWKYLFPTVWIPLMGVWAIAAFQTTAEPGWILFVVGWVIASGYIIWFARRLKFVSIDEDFVYVSQFRKQIQIPLAHIDGVEEKFWARPKLITLTLNHPSEFGKQIMFVPRTPLFAAFRSHPLVEEIEKAIKRHKSAIPPGV
jgi:hypothetical protein